MADQTTNQIEPLDEEGFRTSLGIEEARDERAGCAEWLWYLGRKWLAEEKGDGPLHQAIRQSGYDAAHGRYAGVKTTREFAKMLSKVKVEGYGTDYYHYLAHDHKSSLWERIWRGISRDTLSERDRIHAIIHENIRSKVSSKYGTVVLQVTDQDPVVAALLADSVRAHLEKHLADYARVRYTRDLKTAISKMEDSRRRFEAARDEYTRFRDSHQDLTSAVAESMEDHLMNEYDNTFSAYSRDREQYFRAKAFVDKFSLKFAVLKNASVAQEPSGPVTFGYVSAFLFLAFVATTWWCLGRRTYQEHKAAS